MSDLVAAESGRCSTDRLLPGALWRTTELGRFGGCGPLLAQTIRGAKSLEYNEARSCDAEQADRKIETAGRPGADRPMSECKTKRFPLLPLPQ